MRYVERGVDGKVKGCYANPQPGYAEEAMAENNAELISFLNIVRGQSLQFGFRAHRGGVDQGGGWLVGDYTMLQWPAKTFDTGGRLVGGFWTPVQVGEQPKTVQIGAHVWVKNALAPGNGNPAQYVVKLIKNAYPGEGIATGIGSIGTFPDTNQCVVPLTVDIANPGDHYSLWLFVSHALAAVDGNPAHTFWNGVIVP